MRGRGIDPLLRGKNIYFSDKPALQVAPEKTTPLKGFREAGGLRQLLLRSYMHGFLPMFRTGSPRPKRTTLDDRRSE